jgi:hypothetical protein
LITLIRYVFSVLIWAAVAAILMATGKIVYLAFWGVLGLLLIVVWIGHMVYRVFYLFNPDFKPIKIVVAIAILAVVAVAFFKVFVAPSWNNWGSTQKEIDDDYVVDSYCPEADIRTVRTVEINAPPEYVFRWVRQLPEIGSYGWNLFGLRGKKDADRLLSDLPDLEVGEEFLIGRIVDVDAGRSITFDIGQDPRFPKMGINCMYGGYYFRDAGSGKTRVNVVMRADYDGVWGWFYSQVIIEIGDFFVVKRQMDGIKSVAERNFALSG